MAAPIGLQLYSIREDLARDFEAGVRRIAEMGYVGVETAHGVGAAPAIAARLFRELDLIVPSAHVPLPVGDRKAEALDIMRAFGATRMISGLGSKEFETPAAVERVCEKYNEAGALAEENGMTFGIHNHWWEFGPMGGRRVYQIMLERLGPGIFFELDMYWLKAGGLDPASIVREFGARAPLLHIKDGPATKDAPMTAVGDGVMDFPSIVEAGGAATEWMIVELDKCATDMMDAVVKSYSYLTENRLARGNR